MKITHKTQQWVRLQKAAFYLLLVTVIVLLAKVTTQFNHSYDWTANGRNTLSATSQQLLSEIENEINVQVFVSDDYPYRTEIQSLLARYQRYTDKLRISYIDPNFSPDLVRAMNIERQGEMVISRGEHQQHVFDLSEQSFTNALISIARDAQPWLVFVEGHGERGLFEQNNFSLSTWNQQLQTKGFKVQAINLINQPDIPVNTAALIIAGSQTDWLAGEISLVKRYLEQGGNLLWLVDPRLPASLNSLAESLGIEINSGTVLDPNALLLGINDPRFVLINDYANHPVGKAMSSVSLLADAAAIQQTHHQSESGWLYTNLLNSQADAWVETTPVTAENAAAQRYDSGADIPGPISLGYVLTREGQLDKSTSQRVAILGDSDFISNGYIGNAANLELAMALANWLSHDDELITIPLKTSIGTQLNLSQTQAAVIGFGFLLVLPILLMATGFMIWWRRRQR